MNSVTTVPVSALLGDNVVEPSTRTPWYTGPTVLRALEDAPAGTRANQGLHGGRLPVQWVVRHPGGGRSYAGMVTGGTFRPGDEIVVLPGGRRFRLKHTTRLTPAHVLSVYSRVDIGSLELEASSRLGANDIGVVRLGVGTPLAVDRYQDNRVTGSFAVIDEQTNATVAAGLVGAPVLALHQSRH
jgi:bifunctional enzyme CysN/CysC